MNMRVQSAKIKWHEEVLSLGGRAAAGASAASIVNEQTGNLKLAQKFLGHSTIKVTADIYTHTSAEADVTLQSL